MFTAELHVYAHGESRGQTEREIHPRKVKILSASVQLLKADVTRNMLQIKYADITKLHKIMKHQTNKTNALPLTS